MLVSRLENIDSDRRFVEYCALWLGFKLQNQQGIALVVYY